MVSTIEIPPRAASPLLCRAAVFLRAGDLSKYSLLRLRKSNEGKPMRRPASSMATAEISVLAGTSTFTSLTGPEMRRIGNDNDDCIGDEYDDNSSDHCGGDEH